MQFIRKEVKGLIRGLVIAIMNSVFKEVTFTIAIKWKVPRDSRRRALIVIC